MGSLPGTHGRSHTRSPAVSIMKVDRGSINFAGLSNEMTHTFIIQKVCCTRGQVSVNKRISVLSNYFDVSFEIYYVRLKYIDSIGQVVQLLILRPASICCTSNSGHVGSRAPNVNKMGCLFYFYTSRVW